MKKRNPFIPSERAAEKQERTKLTEEESKKELTQNEARLKAKAKSPKIGPMPPDDEKRQGKEEP